MTIDQEIKELIKSREYLTAGKILDLEISKNKNNPNLWYLRGIVSLKSKNYPHSLECFDRALQLKKDFEYFRIKGMTYLEMFEFEEALIEFENALKLRKDSEVYFYISLCYMFLDDPRAREYMETAYLRDKEKTKKLLLSFYSGVFENSWELNEKQKKELKELLDSLD